MCSTYGEDGDRASSKAENSVAVESSCVGSGWELGRDLQASKKLFCLERGLLRTIQIGILEADLVKVTRVSLFIPIPRTTLEPQLLEHRFSLITDLVRCEEIRHSSDLSDCNGVWLRDSLDAEAQEVACDADGVISVRRIQRQLGKAVPYQKVPCVGGDIQSSNSIVVLVE